VSAISTCLSAGRNVLRAVALIALLGVTANVCSAGLIATGLTCPTPKPTDQDPNETDGPDKCMTFSFTVPEVPAVQKKQGSGGWGWLVLTFDEPIDGGSFVFNPDCPTPIDGVLNAADGNMTIRLGPGNYGLGATGADATVGPGKNLEFEVTITYDDGTFVPNLTFGYWKSKTADFTYRPQGTLVDGQPIRNFDIELLPEPSYRLPLVLAGGLLVFLGKRRRARLA